MEPLDYRNPLSRKLAAEPARRRSAEARAAVPIEFDLKLIQTHDLAAAGAIEAALQRLGIESFRTEDVSDPDHPITLLIRTADQPRAQEVADQIVQRRQRIKSLPRQTMPPPKGILPAIGFGLLHRP